MSPHQQFDRQFTIHKEVQILTKKQERRTTNLDDTPLYSHANLLSCLFILLYSDFLHLRLYFSFVFLHINLKCICPAAVPATMVPTFAATFAPSFAATLAVSLDASFAAVLAVSFAVFLASFFPASTFLIRFLYSASAFRLKSSAPLDAVPVTGLVAT